MYVRNPKMPSGGCVRVSRRRVAYRDAGEAVNQQAVRVFSDVVTAEDMFAVN
ncbi:MAG: hypothetical protein AVDCRST_MAG86-314 [uncultured Truepera sp.]|uniref:Uncharacterized protein n=1 Tax=uncultured Truepera sp. TaxID=543023 RepID=A0A6J4UT42_9DEIN|nr:MAG: hypothetical protein AVDCRST_MAG86-314 [uncultured Truepera sp.]